MAPKAQSVRDTTQIPRQDDVVEPPSLGSPGKNPSTRLPQSTRPSATPIQRKPTGTAPQSGPAPTSETTARWMNVAMRPDVYTAPVQRKADSAGASRTDSLASDSAVHALPIAVQRTAQPGSNVVQFDGAEDVGRDHMAWQRARRDVRETQQTTREQVRAEAQNLIQLEARVASDRSARNELQASLARAKQRVVTAQASKEELGRKIAEADAAIAGAKSELDGEQAEHAAIKLQQEDLQSELDQVNELIESLTEQLERETAQAGTDASTSGIEDGIADGAPAVDSGQDGSQTKQRLAAAKATQKQIMEQDGRLRAVAASSAEQCRAAAEQLDELEGRRRALNVASLAQQQKADAAKGSVERRTARLDDAQATLAQSKRALKAGKSTHRDAIHTQQQDIQAAELRYEVASQALLDSIVLEAGVRLGELANIGLPQPLLVGRIANASTQEDVHTGVRIAIQAWNALPSTADTGATKTAMGTYTAALVAELGPWVYSAKLRARKWHQFGHRRGLREQLKTAARTVVGQEIHAQLAGSDESDARKAYHESLAKRDAYAKVKPEVDEFLQEVGTRIAQSAIDHHKEDLAGIAFRGVGLDGGALSALEESDGKALVKGRCELLVDDLFQRTEGGDAEIADAPVQNPAAEMGQKVAGSEIVTQAIESTSSQEAVGVLGKLLDTVIPDAGDGIALNTTLKIPVMSDPFGGVAGQLFLVIQVNGKAGRGTDGYVTAGVPSIAENPDHLELEGNYSIGFTAETGSKKIAGMDLGVKYESFVRVGADSTLDAMAAFRYGIYRGTPIKALASAWYGGLKKGRGPQGADHLLAEQRAAATEEEHFLAEGKEGTFAHHGRGIGVSASAGALGADAELSGGGRRFHAFTADSLRADHDGLEAGAIPHTQEEALARRRQIQGAIKKSFALSAATKVNWGGQGFSVSGAISGGGLTNWGVELKAGLSGAAAAGKASVDFIVTLATAIYELEHKLLSAFGKHLDRVDEIAEHQHSESEIKEKLVAHLGKGALTTGVAALPVAGAGFAESSLAASFQFGLSDGTWTDRFDLISSTKLATPDSIPISGSLEKETRLIAAQHMGRDSASWMSPGVHAIKTRRQDEE